MVKHREVCKGPFLQPLNIVTKLILVVESLENEPISNREYLENLKLHWDVKFLSAWRNNFHLLPRIHAPHISTAGPCAEALQNFKAFWLGWFFDVGKVAVDELERPFVVSFLAAVMKLVQKFVEIGVIVGACQM